jgi:hypothetical protein
MLLSVVSMVGVVVVVVMVVVVLVVVLVLVLVLVGSTEWRGVGGVRGGASLTAGARRCVICGPHKRRRSNKELSE